MALDSCRPGAGHGNASQENSSSWFAIVRPESNRRRSLESKSNARRRSPTVRTANLQPHQFRTRNDLAETQQTQSRADENGAKSTKLIDSLPLITVWFLVRVQAGPPAFAREASEGCRAEALLAKAGRRPRATAGKPIEIS